MGILFTPMPIPVSAATKNKKADVVHRPKAFYHVGLLFTESPGWAELFFASSSDDNEL